MNKKKMLLTAQSALCVIIAVMLIAAVLGICREGLVLKAADPLSRIYTREKAAAALRPVLPLLVLSLILMVSGLFPGIRGEKAAKLLQHKSAVEKGPGNLKENGAAQPGAEKRKYVRLHALRGALLLLAVGLIAAGVMNGSARDVFSKAVKICSECIGLG